MHILVAVDRSTESRNALTSAFDIASVVDGTVTAVHAVADDGRSTGASTDSDAPADERADVTAADRGEAILAEAAERAGEREISIETQLLVGDPVESIAEFAEARDVDVIYVGHRGLSGESGDLSGEGRGPLGSVAKGLVERTRVPVTVFDRGL